MIAKNDSMTYLTYLRKDLYELFGKKEELLSNKTMSITTNMSITCPRCMIAIHRIELDQWWNKDMDCCKFCALSPDIRLAENLKPWQNNQRSKIMATGHALSVAGTQVRQTFAPAIKMTSSAERNSEVCPKCKGFKTSGSRLCRWCYAQGGPRVSQIIQSRKGAKR